MRRPHPAISLTASASLVLAAAPALAVEAVPNAPGVRVGQADGFTRIEFAGLAPRSARRDGDDLVLHFPKGAAPPGLALLHVTPPRYVAKADTQDTGQGLQLRLTLARGAEAKVGRADGVAYVNIYPGDPGPAPADQPPDRTRDPVPASGVVKLHASLQKGVLALRFDWRAPVGAAVFRRGDAVWIVFDAKAVVDTSELPAGLPQARKVELVPAGKGTALRVVAPNGVQASASSQGASWTVSLGPATGAEPALVMFKTDGDGLSAQMAGASGVFWLDDPSIGDRLAVVTALGPAKGVSTERRLVDADVYASAQGMALAPLTNDLNVTADGDVVRLGRASGLQLSADAPASAALTPPPTSLPQPAAMPGLIDAKAWSDVGSSGFLGRYQALQEAASEESALGRDAATVARFGLARFLVGSDLSFEAIGVLDLLAKTNPQVVSTAEFRGLRGAARVMAGRYKDAQGDLSSPAVSDDPASALWRGYAAAKLGDNTGARQAFAAGMPALNAFAPEWKARFLLADSEAAIAGNDLPTARSALQSASQLKPAGIDGDRLQLDLGRLAEAGGQLDQALTLYATAQASPYGGVSAPAMLHATEIQQGEGKITPDAAAGLLASVRFRWRGDGTELEAARALGRLYIAQGRYRDALAALRSSETASSDLPASAALHGDLQAAFRSLFLDGAADGLSPVQALGLFLDFKELTPVGADGDQMVRKLARRLVDVDLLQQAADLLKYQADNRLDGIARAEVDTDLALIQVMDRQPEQALDALNASRTTLLPPELQSRRRVIQSRALAALGRYDDALEILDADSSHDADAARAEVYWRRRDWPQVGRRLEVALGDRFKSAAPLDSLETGELLRAAIAYSLAGDEAGLTRLRTRYGRQAEASAQAPLLKVALAGAENAYAPGDVHTADTFSAWVAAMKARLMTSGLAKA